MMDMDKNYWIAFKEKLFSHIQDRAIVPLLFLSAALGVAFVLGLTSYHRYQQANTSLQRAKQILQQLKLLNQQLQNQVIRVSKVNQAFKQIDEQGEDAVSLKIRFSDQLQSLAKRHPIADLKWQYDVVQQAKQDASRHSQFYNIYFLPVRIQFEVKTEQIWLDVMDALYAQSPYYQFHNCQLKALRENSQQGNLSLKNLQVDCQLKLAFYQSKTKPTSANVLKPSAIGRI